MNMEMSLNALQINELSTNVSGVHVHNLWLFMPFSEQYNPLNVNAKSFTFTSILF